LVVDIIQLVAQTCGIDSTTFDAHTDLASLGVDSLLSIEIFSRLQRLFPRTRLNAQTLAFCHTITEIVEELCSKQAPDMGGLSSSSTLVSVADGNESLGLGSNEMRSIAALEALPHNLGYDLPPYPFTSPTTLRAVEFSPSNDQPNSVPGCAAAAANALTPPIDPEIIVKAFRLGEVPIPIQKCSSLNHFPLFLIHDGSGLISYYDRLSPIGRDVWGIHNPHFVHEVPWPWDGLTSMATEYVNYVLKVTSDPVLIGGKPYLLIFNV
jgi:acyl carrier protein